MYKYFKTINTNGNISGWRSKGLSNESIKTPSTSNNSLNPFLDYVNSKIRVKFNGSCLKQDKVTYGHETIVDIYIVYEINKNYNISNYTTLENCLFEAVSLNADIDQYKYLGMALDLIENVSLVLVVEDLEKNL